jgi:hypothetical protein
MKKLFILFFFSSTLSLSAQFKLNVSYDKKLTNESYAFLLKSKEELRLDSFTNEQIIDLVEPHTLDSIIVRKYQHHRLFMVGWMIHLLGYHWISVDYHRHKVVGTLKHEFSMSGEEQFTEFDINMDISIEINKRGCFSREKKM